MRLTYDDFFMLLGFAFLAYFVGSGKIWDTIIYLGHL